jgi:hypothetical protein
MATARRSATIIAILILVSPTTPRSQEKKPLSTKEIAWLSVAIGTAAVIAILSHRDAARAQAAEPCDGQPNWCFTFRSQAELEAEVFIDGKSIGRLSPGKQLRVPRAAGGEVFVNYCWRESQGGLFDPSRKRCSDPQTFEMNRNWTYLIYPSGTGM